jgi:hypothetical protein
MTEVPLYDPATRKVPLYLGQRLGHELVLRRLLLRDSNLLPRATSTLERDLLLFFFCMTLEPRVE